LRKDYGFWNQELLTYRIKMKSIGQIIWLGVLIFVATSCIDDPEEFRITGKLKNTYLFEGQINSTGNSTILDQSGNIIVGGNKGDQISVFKVSKSGYTIWRKDYAIRNYSRVNAIVQMPDQNIFICGSTIANYADSRTDVLLVKTNSKGDTLWTKVYGGESFDSGINMIVTSDNHLLIAGQTQSFGANLWGDIYVLKINLDGSLVWSKNYPNAGQQLPSSLMELSDGNYLITGNHLSQGIETTNESYLLKIDPNGNKIWDRKYNLHEWVWSYSSIELSNGEILTCGSITENGYSQVLVLRVNPEGNYYSERKYGEPEASETGYVLKKDRDDTYTIAGTSFNVSASTNEIIVFKIGANGLEHWFKRFKRPSVSIGLDLVKDTDGANIITGNFDDNIFMTILDNNGTFR
jgi:hypothetical protein